MNLALSGTEKHTTTRINTDFTLTQKLDFITPGLSASALISWDNVFQEDGRGINDLYHNAQQKWIDPTTGKAVYAQPLQGNTNFDFQEGILLVHSRWCGQQRSHRAQPVLSGTNQLRPQVR